MTHIFTRKKLQVGLLIILTALFLVPQFALAQTGIGTPNKDTKYGLKTVGDKVGGDLPFTGDEDAGQALPIIIGDAFSLLLSLLGLIFLILIVYGGMRWMLARGDEGEVKKAKDIIVDSLIGLIIVVAAFAIVNFLFDEFLLNLGSAT